MWVLMVVSSNFPNKDASAVRDNAFAQIYRMLGYKVYLIGKGTADPNGIYNGVGFVSVNNGQKYNYLFMEKAKFIDFL